MVWSPNSIESSRLFTYSSEGVSKNFIAARAGQLVQRPPASAPFGKGGMNSNLASGVGRQVAAKLKSQNNYF